MNPAEFDEEAEFCMEVVPPETSTSGDIEVILGLPAPAKSLYVMSMHGVEKKEISNGPLRRITVSPMGKTTATFTENGGLWVVNSSFTENHDEFNTKSKAPPHQLAWCGEDCVCLTWLPEQLSRSSSLLLMVGPKGAYNKFIYDGPIHVVTECDGLRVFTQETCEFLQRVPGSLLAIIIVHNFFLPSLSAPPRAHIGNIQDWIT